LKEISYSLLLRCLIAYFFFEFGLSKIRHPYCYCGRKLELL
jgi:hypothetical protein